MRRKILILTDWYLPGTNAGGPVRSIANLVDHLKDEFAFNIVSRNTDYCEDIPYPDIISDDWNELEKHVNVYYFSKDRLSKFSLKDLLFSTDFDVLYLNGIYSWWFSILPLLLVRNSLKKIIVAPRGMFNEQAFSTKGFKKKAFIHLTRWMSLYKHAVFQATNDVEKDRIINFLGKSNQIYIAPNLHRKVKQESWLEKKKERGQLASKECPSLLFYLPDFAREFYLK